MKIANFDYHLPEELIAQEPAPQRDRSRLMVLRRDANAIEHRYFNDIIHYLSPGDTLVLNETKVIPARLMGKKDVTGADIEVLLLRRLDQDRWETLVRPGRRAKPGATLVFGQGMLTADIVGNTEAGGRVLHFNYKGSFEEILDRLGSLPLPPYIKKTPPDPGRYQTVYAREEGSVAAPTAGLHFTPELLQMLRDKGVSITSVLLHVGLGTFRPVQVEDITRHYMHQEVYKITPEAAEIINGTRSRGGRIIAVGTTTTRCLESSSDAGGLVKAGSGSTEIFIYPGYDFKVIDGLVTNFHLPRSTLLMMVSALAGLDKVLGAYNIAVGSGYRFFSFGDAMLII